MDTATEDLYFQKLQQFVQDEDKIVTVGSFALDASISLKDSQKLITKYVEDQRKLYPDELAITYVLTGILKDSGGRAVLMIKEDDLECKEQLFESKPYKLIYSIQKCKNVDFNIIALVDMLDATKIREKAIGSVVSKNFVKKVLKIKRAPPPPPPVVKGKSSFFAPKPGKSTETKLQVKSPETPKNDKKAKVAGNISDMFKAVASKSNQNSDKGFSAKSKKQTGKTNGGLAAFLSNGAQKSLKSNNKLVVNSSSGDDTKNVLTKSENLDNMNDEEIVEVLDVEEKETKHKEEEKATNGKLEKKKRRRDKSKEVPSKRRKRIVERNDSDSDDMFERGDENEDIIDKSEDEPERIPSPVHEKKLPPKNKRRKAVEKTYTDEEGFVVTKMEYVYETASEDENEEPSPPKQMKQREQQDKPKPKAVEKKKLVKNQSTLTNFFKKI